MKHAAVPIMTMRDADLCAALTKCIECQHVGVPRVVRQRLNHTQIRAAPIAEVIRDRLREDIGLNPSASKTACQRSLCLCGRGQAQEGQHGERADPERFQEHIARATRMHETNVRVSR